MQPNVSSSVERVLVAHADPNIRKAVANAVKESGVAAVSVHEAASLPDVVEKVRLLGPNVVLVGLDASVSLALDVGRSVRGSGRLLIGLYDPVVVGSREGELLRSASRAGYDDFVTLPVSAPELFAAFAAYGVVGTAEGAEREGRTIAFTSAKGGVGTTTLALNTALTLASDGGSEVVLCDAALQFGNVADFMGVQPDHDLFDMVRDLDCLGPIESYLVREQTSGLLVLPGPRNLEDAEKVTPGDMSRLVIALRRRYPVVVVDVPPVLDLLTLGILELCEIICLVTEPSMPTVLNTAKYLAALEALGIGEQRVRVLLNREGGFFGSVTAQDVSTELARTVHARIPHDARVADAGDARQAASLPRARGEFAKALKRLSQTLADPAGGTRGKDH